MKMAEECHIALQCIEELFQPDLCPIIFTWKRLPTPMLMISLAAFSPRSGLDGLEPHMKGDITQEQQEAERESKICKE